eukprot:scaffold5612_cov46-Attheya_sp.AAC.2
MALLSLQVVLSQCWCLASLFVWLTIAVRNAVAYPNAGGPAKYHYSRGHFFYNQHTVMTNHGVMMPCQTFTRLSLQMDDSYLALRSRKTIGSPNHNKHSCRTGSSRTHHASLLEGMTAADQERINTTTIRSRKSKSNSKTAVWLCKTRESFRLYELVWLEAQLQSNDTCRCVALDERTGSLLLEWPIHHGIMEEDDEYATTHSNHNSTITRSTPRSPFSRMQRFDFCARSIAVGSSLVDLLETISRMEENGSTHSIANYCSENQPRQTNSNTTDHGSQSSFCWTLEYCAFGKYPNKNAADIQDDADNCLELIVIDVTLDENNNSTKLYYLAEKIPIVDKHPKQIHQQQKQQATPKQWAGRPFQYSSAMNPVAAGIVLDILVSLVVPQQQHSHDTTNQEGPAENGDDTKSPVEASSVTLLDPTCGSGTFLSMALERGFGRVIGQDVNEKCIDGTLQNLRYQHGLSFPHSSSTIHEDNHVQLMVGDSTRSLPPLFLEQSSTVPRATVMVVVANLPWGRHSVNHVNTNRDILTTIAKHVPSQTPCAFITHSTARVSHELKALGFHIQGDAHIPPRHSNSHVLSTNRYDTQRDEHPDGENDRPSRDGDCVVTIALSPDSTS